MNYVEARELSDKTGWHMTTMRDHRISPLSCCREQVPATEQDVKDTEWIYMGRLKVGDLIDGPPHTPHETRADAEKCFHDWLDRQLEETLKFDDSLHMNWVGCEATIAIHDDPEVPGKCDEPTKGGARYQTYPGPEHVALCPIHRTLEVVKSLARHPTSITHS